MSNTPHLPRRDEGHPYQDATLPVEQRVEDLISRMTLAEKAGQLFHQMIAMHPDGSTVERGDAAMMETDTTHIVTGQRLTHVNLLGQYAPRAMATWHNNLQALAAETRLGIPVTLSTDPRHSFTDNMGASFNAGAFSAWPEALGFGALQDAEAVRRFADIMRREYVAVGFRTALHPQIDLATEPRWSRQSGTFGSDAHITGKLVRAYVEGLQGQTLGKDSVSAMVKHFPGGGAQLDGEDPHFPWGREQVYPGGMRDYHLAPFKEAIAAGCAQMMPYYGMPVGTDWEEVGFGINQGVVTGLLRQQLGFDGIVCTDWGLVTDQDIFGERHQARAWGLEGLPPLEKAYRVLQAGCDQFGGESCPELIIELVEAGRVPESRLDASLRRILRQKFTLGLFDEQRYVDPDLAEETVGHADFVAEGAAVQRRSLTVLVNKDSVLPIARRPKVYIQNFPTALVEQYADVVGTPAEADFALLRLRTPYEPRANRFESHFHGGTLAFTPEVLKPLLAVMEQVPTIVCLNLERPAVIPEIAENAAALMTDYGASLDALLDVVFGKATPEGRLPFELPRSMEAVRAARSDVPNDTENPVFAYGYGLSL
ncbi:glycoside hydrolase family 3 N-terminal domain-containing protein [Streptomyces sp. NBC_00063]|uniref:glycoside hydrolase family 3 protein n=1 Tax=Streptomyces sp. NBC_00063 TaxID=2975638 RepID=UPI003D705A2F